MIPRPCLDCSGMATRDGRCDSCRAQWNARRNAHPQRAKYNNRWRAISEAARAEQPFCSLCYRTTDLTLDHTTGLVVCRACHRPESVGGIKEAPHLHGGRERFSRC